MLLRDIRCMPSSLREVMVLHDTDRVSTPQLPKRLGITVGAAESRSFNAHAELCHPMVHECGRVAEGRLSRETAQFHKAVRHRTLRSIRTGVL
jgi:hypothetical protein